MRGPALLLGIACLCGCGGGPRASSDLRAQLAAAEAATLRERAPDLVASVESALDAADRAERQGEPDAASDEVTRARLYLEAARAEAARIEDEDARRALEQELAAVLARARRDEAARARTSRERAREASARTAREEALRALAQAEVDEGRGARRGRVSMEDARDLRRGAAALQARAESVLAAAEALGASAAQRASAAAALRASRASRDPAEALSHADRAHHEALRALGAARASVEPPGRDEPRALAELAEAEGFTALALSEGIGVEARGLFGGRGASLAAPARVRRLASIVHAHPRGPVQVQVQVRQLGAGGSRLAQQRADALVAALVAEGIARERLSARPLPAALAGDEALDASRVVFVAYAP